MRVVSMNALPGELVAHMFKLAYLECRAAVFGQWGNLPEDDYAIASSCSASLVSLSNLRLLSAFPYSLSSVCKEWQLIVDGSFHLWSSIIIFTDSERHTPETLLPRLRKAGGRPIHVVVTEKSSYQFSDTNDEEKERLIQIMNVIEPFLPQCVTLSFKVTNTTSLPRLTTDFPDHAPYLTKLSLKAMEATGLGQLVDMPGGPWAIRYPKLCYLELDGFNMVDIYKNARHWLNQLPNVSNQADSTLRICRYDSAAPYGEAFQFDRLGRFYFLNLVPFMGKFSNIELEDLDFDTTCENAKERAATINLKPLLLGRLVLRELRNDVIDDLLQYCGTRKLVIDGCESSGLPLEFPDHCVTSVEMRSMSGIQTLLENWDGPELRLIDCAVDEALLDFLGNEGEETLVTVPSLSSLYIKGSKDLSVPSLRTMLESRMQIFDDNPDELTPPAAFALKVKGPVDADVDDIEWFEAMYGQDVLEAVVDGDHDEDSDSDENSDEDSDEDSTSDLDEDSAEE